VLVIRENGWIPTHKYKSFFYILKIFSGIRS
jgi:hypothetical protein